MSTTPGPVYVTVGGKRFRCPTPFDAALFLLEHHCTPQEFQRLKLDGWKVQRRYPVEAYSVGPDGEMVPADVPAAKPVTDGANPIEEI